MHLNEVYYILASTMNLNTERCQNYSNNNNNLIRVFYDYVIKNLQVYNNSLGREKDLVFL